MSRKARSQFAYSVGVFLRVTLITFFVLSLIIFVLASAKIVENKDETINVGEEFKQAQISWMGIDVSNIALMTSNNVNVNKVGAYQARYMFACSILKQTIHVVDIEPPTIILNGDDTVYVKSVENYKDPGFTATDGYDGDLTWKVKRECFPDDSEEGKYILFYSVSDSSGNEATAIRVAYLTQ